MTLSFFRFDCRSAKVWALWMMGAARSPLSRIAGLQFWKLCGSGTDEGFTPVPNTSVYAILCVWHDRPAAQQGLAQPVFCRFHRRAADHWTVFLSPVSVRGQWSGTKPFCASVPKQLEGPIAVLTRATIRPSIALRFWRRVPGISAVIGENRDVLFKIGIGEVPLLHQVTFSIWPDLSSMAAFARADGPHARAIKAVRENNWFREELYARFSVIDECGAWGGGSPLSRKAAA
ncbi:spheroidene monooxygenase [Heliomarina baculiformis]|uniref:spheroidene monooxygenase n=1 Tax=Heliomarina baculiformis TaxID=2872036 RepID=UPI001EE30A48